MHCMCGWGHALQRYTLQCDLNNLIYALVFSFNNKNCSRGKNCGEDQIIRLKQVFKSDLKDAIFLILRFTMSVDIQINYILVYSKAF